MNVGELKDLLANIPDSHQVVLGSRGSFAPLNEARRSHYAPSAAWVGTAFSPSNQLPENAVALFPLELSELDYTD